MAESPVLPTAGTGNVRIGAAEEQPAPVRNDLPAIQDLVMADIAARKQLGIERYGTPLQPHNGRNALMDAYQEVLDLAIYLRQLLCEQTGE